MIRPEYDAEVQKLRDNGTRVCGTHYFKGFCIDLAQKVAEKINLTYDICLVQDGMYGAELPNKSWDGMIGELLEKVPYYKMYLFPLCLIYVTWKILTETRLINNDVMCILSTTTMNLDFI